MPGSYLELSPFGSGHEKGRGVSPSYNAATGLHIPLSCFRPGQGDTPRGELGCPGPSGGFQSGAASLTQMLVFSNGGDDVA